MANVYKNIQAKVTSAGSFDDMYTAPDETTSIVKTIKLYNTHGSALDVEIKIYDASSTTDYEYESSKWNINNNRVKTSTSNHIEVAIHFRIDACLVTQSKN